MDILLTLNFCMFMSQKPGSWIVLPDSSQTPRSVSATASEDRVMLQLITRGNLQLCNLLLTAAARHRFSTEISIAVITLLFYWVTPSTGSLSRRIREPHTELHYKKIITSASRFPPCFNLFIFIFIYLLFYSSSFVKKKSFLVLQAQDRCTVCVSTCLTVKEAELLQVWQGVHVCHGCGLEAKTNKQDCVCILKQLLFT